MKQELVEISGIETFGTAERSEDCSKAADTEQSAGNQPAPGFNGIFTDKTNLELLNDIYLDVKSGSSDINIPEFSFFADCRSREEIVDRLVEFRQTRDGLGLMRTPRISLVRDWEDAAIEHATEALVARNTPSKVTVSSGPERANPFRDMDFLDSVRHIMMLSRGHGRPPGLHDAYNEVKRKERYRNIPLNVGRRLLALSVSTAEPIPPWVTMREVKDFGKIEAVSAAALPRLQLIERGRVMEGQYSRLESEIYQIHAYSVWFALTRDLLLTDDLYQFCMDIWAMGQQARALEMQLIFAQILNNPLMADGFPLFSPEHRNIGNSESISLEGLSQARLMLAQQTYPDGQRWKRYLKHILVGPALETLAQKWTMATYANNVQDYNPFGGRLEMSLMPDSKPDWDLWFAIASQKTTGSIFELGYLEGQELPYIMMDEDIRIDGLAFRYGVDRGARVVDWRSFWCNRLPKMQVDDPSGLT